MRLPDASSVLFAELYAIFSAIKYILRMGPGDSVVLSDSRTALAGIRDRFTDSRVPYVVQSIARLLYLTCTRGLVVRFIWIPAHSGILVNEVADGFARSAAGLPFSVCPAFPPGDLQHDLRWDFLAWCRRLCPSPGHGNAGAAYFSRVNFKDPRPWFRGCWLWLWWGDEEPTTSFHELPVVVRG